MKKQDLRAVIALIALSAAVPALASFGEYARGYFNN